ncbi:hypothetical protein A2W24_00195 [Microgenomates group bacterium RBG_16_45_19]|nr:MAG: hypothetical protein A2W24_00195 [Microgenomates group bacterium RBG_16_45_19]
MLNCIFCQIVSGEQPCYQIHADDHFLAFLDIHPQVAGHTLVIPKIHYRHFWDLPDPGALINFAQIIVRHYQTVLTTDLIYAGVKGEIVSHAHLHLLPQTTAISLSLEDLHQKLQLP